MMISYQVAYITKYYLLPNKDIVNHCTSTENDSNAYEDTRHNGWSGVKLDEGVQNDTCRIKTKVVRKTFLKQFSPSLETSTESPKIEIHVEANNVLVGAGKN